MSPRSRSVDTDPFGPAAGDGLLGRPRVAADLGSRSVITPVLDQRSVETQVARLLDELPRRFALAGLSLGGVVALALIRRARERVSALSLISLNPYAPEQPDVVCSHIANGNRVPLRREDS